MTTLVMQCRVVFPANERRNKTIELTQVSGIEFESTWKEITQRGSMTIPRKVKAFKNQSVRDIFRIGDRIEISFGYHPRLIKEFVGYVTSVSADIPITISFEDEMFKIRRMPVNFSAENITLENLLSTIIPGYEIDAIKGIDLGQVRLSRTQVGPVLEKLKSDWNLSTYMRGSTVVCGKYYSDDTQRPTFHFDLERNVVSTSLDYRPKDEIKVKIKAVSTLRDGSKLEVDDVGDPDGDERQLTYYNITSKDKLKQLALIDYEKYKVERFEGNFTAFGTPSLAHGGKVKLTSTLYPDREGIYYVEKVAKTFDQGGIRQIITLGDKAV